MKNNEVSNSMNIINNQIKEGTFSKVYLFYGDEAYLARQYKDKLINAMTDTSDTMNFTVFKEEKVSPNEILSCVTTLPFFSERRVILIESSGYFKTGGDMIADIITDIPDTSCLIFFENEVDKRSRLYKTISKNGVVLSFDTPDEKSLLIWIKRLLKEDNLTVEDAAVYKILEVSGQDMNTISNNVEKVISYCMDKGHVNVCDVSYLCEDHIENKVFDMTDAISLHKKNRALSLYNDLITLNEPAMRILFLINRHYSILAQTKLMLNNGSSYGDIASVVKIPPFTVKKYADQCKNYTYKELIEKTDLCQEADYSIKTGRFTDKSAVEMLIIKLLK